MLTHLRDVFDRIRSIFFQQFPRYITNKVYYRLSHDVVTWVVNRDVSTTNPLPGDEASS